MRRLSPFLLCLALGACASRPAPIAMIEAPTVTMSAPPPAPVAARPAPAAPVNVLTRDYLGSNEPLNGTPVSMVLLPRAPVGKAERAQYEAICEVWRASFPMASATGIAPGEMKDLVIVPVHWLLKGDARPESCKALVEHYDYFRAQLFAAKNGLSTVQVQLVCKTMSGVVVLNLTPLTRQNDMSTAMDAWRDRMVAMPGKADFSYTLALVGSTRTVLGLLGKFVTLHI